MVAFIGCLGAGAAIIAFLLARSGADPPGRPAWLTLPVIAGLLVTAEYLFVRFRYGGQVNALNLVEAVLAPLLYAFPAPAAIATVALAQAAGDTLRRNAPVKTAFNVAQWSLATAVGAALLAGSAADHEMTLTTAAALFAVLGVVGLVNQAAFTIVVALANRQSLREALGGLAPVMVPGWLIGWLVNTTIGLLFVSAYVAHPASTMLFPVPLVVLHLAYRGYAGARSDRMRLSGLHRAARVLAEPLHPADAIAPFLREVAICFEARGAALVQRTSLGRLIHRVDMNDGGRYSFTIQEDGEPSLEGALLAQPRPLRLTADGREPLARALAEAGWSDCLAAPLLDDKQVAGVLLVLDQTGLEGFEAGELAVIDALARETVGAFAKGRLLEAILEERRKLSEIVTSTSDGILTIAIEGTVRSWNPAIEKITGLRASDVVDLPTGLVALRLRTLADEPVHFERWATGETLPPDVRLTRPDGATARLSCSYSYAFDPDGSARTLVVVARDVTAHEEIKELRQDLGRMAEAEAAQRAIVEQLQEAVMPARPTVADTELGVSYLASDPTSPTGGDLYDWQLLPSGELHFAVVDVLGHGVAATKNALSVVHTLRLLTAEGTPLEEIIARADALLGSQHPDLVATVMLARYDPQTGRLRLAAGGHPPALVVSAAGGIRQLPAPGGAIGWPAAGSAGVAEGQLGPGDALVVYTDGLVEARKDIIEGTETLMRHARDHMDLPAEELAAALVHGSLAGADRRDDSLALVVRRAPVEAQPATWRIAPDGSISETRHAFAAWLDAHGITGEVREDLVLVASELLTNASTVARASVDLRVSLQRDVITVEVEDDGEGDPDLALHGADLPEPFAYTGRGLYIVRALSDDVEILSTFEGSVVRCRRRVPTAASAIARLQAARPQQPDGPQPRP